MIVIVLTCTALGVALAYRKKIGDEICMIRRAEILSLKEDLAMSYFYPLSKEEREQDLLEYIQQLKLEQEKLSCSWIAKRFIDYREEISKHENEITEGEESSRKLISFSTFGLHHVIAEARFQKEALLVLADLIDQTFDPMAYNALFNVEMGKAGPVIEATFIEGFEECGQGKFQVFADAVSKQIFDQDKVVFCAGAADSDVLDTFISF